MLSIDYFKKYLPNDKSKAIKVDLSKSLYWDFLLE